MPEIADTTVVTRNADLMTAPVHDETMIMDIKSGTYYGLDDIGTAIWLRLETPKTFGALIDSLVAEYDAERSAIVSDVAKLLTLMTEHKVVTLA